MGAITAPNHQPSDREITVKDNQKNVIAVPPAPEISESPAPVVGLSHGRLTMEEVRQILNQAVETTASKAINKRLGSRIHQHFARIGGLELELPTRSDTPSAPELNP